MESTVYFKSYPPPDYNMREIMRYMGAKELDGEAKRLFDECMKEAGDELSYKVVWREFDIKTEDGITDLVFARVESRDLKKALAGAKKIILFAATVGLGIDRLIARYKRISPAKSLMFSAIGSERIESLCDLFCDELKREGTDIGKRYSPGYGDLSLELQRDIMAALLMPKTAGISLNENLLMSPSKSVTAILGIR